MIKKKEKGFALIMALVLLLVMSLMGGSLIVIASGDHRNNNNSDEYQQAFYVAETALMEGEKSLADKIQFISKDFFWLNCWFCFFTYCHWWIYYECSNFEICWLYH